MTALMMAALLLVEMPPVVRAVWLLVVAAGPWSSPAALAGTIWSVRRGGDRRGRDDVLVLVAIAAELRSGQTLRTAIAAVAERDRRLTPAARLALAGRPMAEVSPALGQAVGRFGHLTEVGLGIAEQTGGAIAPVFERLAAEALAADDLDRERRAASAPVVAQAVIVGGVPLAVLVWSTVGGRTAALIAAGPAQALVMTVGAALVLAGAAWVSLLAWRARR